MSLFPLAALAKEPRFIPPHRLAVRRRRYKWPLPGNARGWEGGEGEEEGRGYTIAAAVAIARKKMFVDPAGGGG